MFESDIDGVAKIRNFEIKKAQWETFPKELRLGIIHICAEQIYKNHKNVGDWSSHMIMEIAETIRFCKPYYDAVSKCEIKINDFNRESMSFIGIVEFLFLEMRMKKSNCVDYCWRHYDENGCIFGNFPCYWKIRSILM